MQSSKKNTLEARGIHVSFGGVTALTEVNLTVHRGEVVGLIGPNGAGKTTMVNVLSGFQRPGQGEVYLDDVPISRLKARDVARAGVSRSFQAARLFRDLTVEQNLAVAGIGSGLSGHDAYKRSREILDWIGCARIADKTCDSLSYGDERRISIARALALAPSFAMLDEPASGMSDSECDELMHVISRIPERFDCAILLIEHNMKVIMGLCSRIHVLDGGRSLAEGTPAEVQHNKDVRRAYLGEKSDRTELAI
ncbi:MAG: ABC transporter ATP-binding protein [Mesorhizobium sp.]|nr:ABC transporter ATP-binding protein [Mesorhizobium sp.]